MNFPLEIAGLKELSMYDLIGDIHGHADELEQLLNALDYKRIRGVYSKRSS